MSRRFAIAIFAAVPIRIPIMRIVLWSLTPFGIGTLSDDLAWASAFVEHKERIEELERTATDDDRFNGGFFGYDFPEFVATISNVLRPLPSLLREIVGNPFVTYPVERLWLTPSVSNWLRVSMSTKCSTVCRNWQKLWKKENAPIPTS